MSAKQYRNFATILYPESMPEDIWEKLEELHIPIAVSPLHDQDVLEDTGELKKAHYHVLICLNGKKTEKAMREMLTPLGCSGLEIINDKLAYSRYLCHLDSETKHRYNTEDIRYFGGLVLDLAAKGSKGTGELVAEISAIIEDNKFTSPKSLVRFLCSEQKYDLLKYVEEHAYFVRTFLL